MFVLNKHVIVENIHSIDQLSLTLCQDTLTQSKMITGLGFFFLRSEEITEFQVLNSIKIPFIAWTCYHHTQGVEFLKKTAG